MTIKNYTIIFEGMWLKIPFSSDNPIIHVFLNFKKVWDISVYIHLLKILNLHLFLIFF